MPGRLEHTEVEESHTPCRVIDFSLLPCLPQKGKKCIRTPKIFKPIKFELSGCTSMKTSQKEPSPFSPSEQLWKVWVLSVGDLLREWLVLCRVAGP